MVGNLQGSEQVFVVRGGVVHVALRPVVQAGVRLVVAHLQGLGPLGLAIRTVRSRGYMLERADPPDGMVPVLADPPAEDLRLDDEAELQVRLPAS